VLLVSEISKQQSVRYMSTACSKPNWQ